MKNDQKKQNSFHQSVGLFMSIGTTMMSNLLVGVVIGLFLDKHFATKPWLTLIFILIGAAAGFKSIYMLAKNINNE